MKTTILVVDDEPDVSESLVLLLGRQYDVLTTDTLKGALAILSRVEVEVVILDLNLRDSRGPATAEVIHKAVPTVAIVVYSGFINTPLGGIVEECVTKGSPVEELLAALERAQILRKVTLMYAPFKRDLKESKEIVQEMKSNSPCGE